MIKKKCAVLFSGGKDSCLALYHACKKYDVCYLLSLIPRTQDSWMFHTPDLKLLEKQAEMLDIKLIFEYTRGKKEEELDDLKKLLNRVVGKVDTIVIGGIASNYQGERVKRICSELNLELYAPLWGYNAERLWKELLAEGFKVILTKIASEGIEKEFLGKIIDDKLFAELEKRSKKYKFRMDFEGGDAETAVLFMPGMQKEIRLKTKTTSEDRYRHFIKIIEVR